MEQGEFGQARKKTELDIKTHLRQLSGIDRHFRGGDGFGWFIQDPGSIAPEQLQRHRFKINEIIDRSGELISEDFAEIMEVESSELLPGSFSIGVDLGRGASQSGEFLFCHPEDVGEILQLARVESPRELIGREIIVYWIGKDDNTPMAGDPTVGVALPSFSIPLSELREGHQGK